MELKKIQFNNLFWLFLKQLLILAISIFIEIVVFVLCFIIGLEKGLFLPANYSINYLEQNKETISKIEPFDKSFIPHTCKYGLFTYDGKYLSGNFSDDMINKSQIFIKNGDEVKYRFFLCKRKEGYCIISYDISAHFSSPILNKFFPKLELSLVYLFIIVFIITIINRALSFGKNLRKELKPLLEEINQIQNRELEMERKISSIKEFDDILLSLYDMKIALSKSLKKEWETEQNRKKNISALAHDIKTPLTIIKGNSELIEEENNIEDIRECANIINNNSDKIERYIKLLIEATNHNVMSDNSQKIKLSTLVNEIIFESEAICKAKDIKVIIDNLTSDVEILINIDLIERAILNIIRNAIEHTVANKKLKLKFELNKNSFVVTVEDFGEGFTNEALKYAKNQFYTEKYERSEEHYGLGMYFANNVAEKYNGNVTYWNKSNKTGSVVVFKINI